ncbi:CRYZ [Symbiodinium sp. KB8]|nr:CRYZ [Symbiodinium sp. KB8]
MACTGTYAEQCLVDVSDIFPLPDNITFAQGAALGVPYGTAHRALFIKGKAHKGQSVLIHGATGGVGIAAVQLAKAAGLKVIATGGTEEGLKLLSELGAEVTANHRKEGDVAEVKAATGGKGVDLIIEMAAHANLGKDLPLLSHGGSVVVVGSRGKEAPLAGATELYLFVSWLAMLYHWDSPCDRCHSPC